MQKKIKTAENIETLKGFKGFDPNFKCQNKQYKENSIATEKTATICNSGIRFCESPFFVWDYYPIFNNEGNKNIFAEVEALAKPETEDNQNFYTTKLKIGAKLDLCCFVKAGVNFLLEKVKATTGNSAHSATTGNLAHSATTGDWAHSATTGNSAHSATTGDWAHSATTGNYAHSATMGDSAHSATTGDWAHSATTGNSAHSATTGGWAHSATTGVWAHSAVNNKNAIASALGYGSKAKGVVGSWLVLAEYDFDEEGNIFIKCVKTTQVDGETIKPNTFYTLEDGEFVEATNE